MKALSGFMGLLCYQLWENDIDLVLAKPCFFLHVDGPDSASPWIR